MNFTINNSRLSEEDRVRGAIWGSLTGDAYCLGSHWVYDTSEMTRRFPDGIKGFEPPAQGQYHYGKKSGDFTHYGDAALLMLASVAQTGRFDVVDFGSRFLKLSIEETYNGYRDHATKGMIENYRAHFAISPDIPFDYQQGADDDQPATVTRLAPVVAAHLHDPNLPEIVTVATRVSQNNLRAVAFAQGAALLLRHLLNGASPEAAVAGTRQSVNNDLKEWHEVSRRMKIACAARILPVNDATMLFGQSCPLLSSFPAALQTMLACSGDFAEAIHSVAGAGGDNAGRAAMVGAWLGAYHGVQGIPAAWRNRLNAHDQIESDIEKIVTGLKSRQG